MNSSEGFSEYLSTLDPQVAQRVINVLDLADHYLPEATKSLVYQIPTYTLHGKHVFHVAGYKNHIGIYPGPRILEVFASQLSGYKTSRGTWQIQHKEELPQSLIIELLQRIYRDSL